MMCRTCEYARESLVTEKYIYVTWHDGYIKPNRKKAECLPFLTDSVTLENSVKILTLSVLQTYIPIFIVAPCIL